MSEKVLTQNEARRLTIKIKSALATLDEDLKYFHSVQGWLPLGYDSFTVWWDNELGEIPISTGLRNWAIHAMIQENTEPSGRMRRGMTSVIAHATGMTTTSVSKMKTRARPKTRYHGRPDAELVPFGIMIPARWHRHMISLSNSKDKSMADITRPILKDGVMRHYGVDLDAPIERK